MEKCHKIGLIFDRKIQCSFFHNKWNTLPRIDIFLFLISVFNICELIQKDLLVFIENPTETTLRMSLLSILKSCAIFD